MTPVELARLAQERDELDRTDKAVMRKLDLRILDLEKSRDGWMAQAEREGALVHVLKAELTDRTRERDLFQQENHRLLGRILDLEQGRTG